MIVTNPFSPGSLTRETINTVASGWWVLLLSGIVGVVAGGIILFTDWTVSQLVTFVGLLFIFRGVLTAVSLPVDGSMRGSAVAVGLLEVGIGIGVFTWPRPTLLVLALMIRWWGLFSGITTTTRGGAGHGGGGKNSPGGGRARPPGRGDGPPAPPLRGGAQRGGRAQGGRAPRQGLDPRLHSARGVVKDRSRSRHGPVLRQPRPP